jgi:RimJ/RimL family protein N-acetyltransferase
MDGGMSAAELGRGALVLEGRLTRLVRFAAVHRDDEAYLGWLRDADVVRTLNLPHYLSAPVAHQEIAAYCDAMMASSRDLFMALHDLSDGAFIGTLKAAAIDRYAGVADIGIMLGVRERWGRGLATDAVATFARHLFEELGLRRLTAGAMAINAAMIAVFEKLGFRREGSLREQDRYDGGYCDHVYLGCMRDEFRPPK